MQPYGVRRVRLGVLLVVQEGDNRLALLESVWLHVLGHEAMVAEKEAFMAARDTRWSACDDCARGRDCCASDDYR